MSAHTKGELYVFGDDALGGSIPFIEMAIGECPSPEFKSVCHVQCTITDDEDFVLTDEDRANAAHLALCWNMHPDLVEALEGLLGGKCPECKGWGEIAYFGEMVGCRCNDDYRHVPTEAQISFARALLARSQETKS